MKSLLGYLSPYVRHLENELIVVRAERDTLLDRLVRVTTGWGMDQPMPDIITAQREAEEATKQQRGPRTAFDLAREMERMSLEESENPEMGNSKNETGKD